MSKGHIRKLASLSLYLTDQMMQNTIHGRDVTEGRPKLKAYVDRVKNRLNPVFDEVHEVVYAWRDSYNK